MFIIYIVFLFLSNLFSLSPDSLINELQSSIQSFHLDSPPLCLDDIGEVIGKGDDGVVTKSLHYPNRVYKIIDLLYTRNPICIMRDNLEFWKIHQPRCFPKLFSYFEYDCKLYVLMEKVEPISNCPNKKHAQSQIEKDLLLIHHELTEYRISHFDTDICNWGLNSEGRAVLIDVESSICSEHNYSLLLQHELLNSPQGSNNSSFTPLTRHFNRLGIEASLHIFSTWETVTKDAFPSSPYFQYLHLLSKFFPKSQTEPVTQKITQILTCFMQHGKIPESSYYMYPPYCQNRKFGSFPLFKESCLTQKDPFAVLQYLYLFFPFETQEALEFIDGINHTINQLNISDHKKKQLYLDKTSIWTNDNPLPSSLLLTPLRNHLIKPIHSPFPSSLLLTPLRNHLTKLIYSPSVYS